MYPQPPPSRTRLRGRTKDYLVAAPVLEKFEILETARELCGHSERRARAACALIILIIFLAFAYHTLCSKYEDHDGRNAYSAFCNCTEQKKFKLLKPAPGRGSPSLDRHKTFSTRIKPAREPRPSIIFSKSQNGMPSSIMQKLPMLRRKRPRPQPLLTAVTQKYSHGNPKVWTNSPLINTPPMLVADP
ncbi:hypothetical protein EVAR_11708_1 [Eumeta japonica]|uniref:Uncharacterized protein n=1 Tax=Eumeta variegata TaxID=151549 RepID=A0A4C1U4P3_EUMVA|nr:hypothetical protein EVAR_11708_1 [Eumeta japonica]